MSKPNFLIIGAPKSGTTSLYNYLSQHPDIGLSKNKEPKYFSFKDSALDFKGNITVVNQIKKSTIQNFDDYQNLFKSINSKFIGEASPNYLHVPCSAKNIYDFNPTMKLVVILRNPIEKTFSDWKHNYSMGYESVNNFKKALDLIEERKEQNYVPYFDYLEKGKYASHIERYYKYFNKDQLKIIFFDDFKVDANASCNDVIKFLGIDDSFDFKTQKIHMKARTIYKSDFLKRISTFSGNNLNYRIKNFIDRLNIMKPQMSSIEYDYLKNYFIEDIKKLETITGRDLSHWVK